MLFKRFKKQIFDYIDSRVDKTREYIVEEVSTLQNEINILKEEMLFLNSKEEYRLVEINNSLLFFTRNNDNSPNRIVLRLSTSRISSNMNYQVEKYEKDQLIPNAYNLVISFRECKMYPTEFQALFLIEDDMEYSNEPVKIWRANTLETKTNFI